jgi:D-lactate dehydrogenase (cytochrome)
MLTKTNPDEIQGWLSDASNMQGGHAAQVVFPATAQEVADVLAEATRTHTPVTVSGAGTGVTGGRVPFGGIVLATERLPRQLEIENDCARVSANVRLHEVQQAVAACGWFYPPDPTEWSCAIGGTIATNASGARTFKYGATRAYVRGLQLALTTGDVIELRRGEIRADAQGCVRLPLPNGRMLTAQLPSYRMPTTRKHAAGYFVAPEMDAVDLFIGSEGTLAVITAAELALLPQPEAMLAGVVFFDAESDLLAFVAEARAASRAGEATIDALALEYFDAEALNFLRPHYPRVPGNVAGAVFFEQTMTAATEDEVMSVWLALLEAHRARLDDSWFATNENDHQALREFRHHLPVLVNEWIARQRQRKVSTDMAVPDAEFAAMLAFYQESLRASGLRYVIFGHIGDNHVHVNILPRDDAEAIRARALYRRFIELAVAVSGTVSAEHGIGKLKRDYLRALYGEAALREMAALKAAFDPAGILGRGNMFAEEYLLAA